MKFTIFCLLFLALGLPASACAKKEHQCKGTDYCIQKDWFCDGTKDCDNGEDEEIGCKKCLKGEFRCGKEQSCYPLIKFCDGFSHCKDYSDEYNCITFKNDFVIANHYGDSKFYICSTNWNSGHSDVVCKFVKDRSVKKTSYEAVKDSNFSFIQLKKTNKFNIGIPEMNYFEKSKQCKSKRFVKLVCGDSDGPSLSLERCGVRGNVEGYGKYILGGHEARHGAHPWHVQIFHNNKYLCGGTLTDKRYILTLAYCVNDIKYVKDLRVMIGTTVLNPKNDKKYNISHLIMHPMYNHTLRINDVAMLRIKEEIKFQKDLKPICLPQKYNRKKPPTQQSYRFCVLIGFGTLTKSKIEPDGRMHQSRMNMMIEEECAKALQKIGKKNVRYYQEYLAKNNIMCAGSHPTETGPNTCWFDKGSPLVCKELNGPWAQVGIATDNLLAKDIKDCSISLFVKVDHQLDFIKTVQSKEGIFNKGTIKENFVILTIFYCLITLWMLKCF